MAVAVHQGFTHNRWNFDSNVVDYFRGDYHYHRITRYVLWKYENHLGTDQDRKVSAYDYLNMSGNARMQSTVEHISAQQPRDGDQTHEFVAKYLNNVGNLALMPKGMNSSLGNSPEAEKQPRMQNSSYAAHREVADMMGPNREWSSEIILARKAKILTFLLNRWEVSLPESAAL